MSTVDWLSRLDGASLELRIVRVIAFAAFTLLVLAAAGALLRARAGSHRHGRDHTTALDVPMREDGSGSRE